MADHDSNVSEKEPEQDEITPQDSVSNVTRSSTSSKALLKAAQEEAELEARMRYQEGKEVLEMSLIDMEAEDQIAEIEDKAERAQFEAEQARLLAEQEAEKARLFAVQQAEQARFVAQKSIYSANETAAKEKEIAQRKVERERRRRRAEIALRRMSAMSDLEAARSKREVTSRLVGESRSAVSRVKWESDVKKVFDDPKKLDDSVQARTDTNVVRSKIVTDPVSVQVKAAVAPETYASLDRIVSPLITTTASAQPLFFDDREYLFTGIRGGTERGRFNSTTLPQMVTNLSETLYASPMPSARALKPPESTPVKRPLEVIMKGTRRSTVPCSAATTIDTGAMITTAAPTYKSFGDDDGIKLNTDYQRYLDSQPKQQVGYVPPVSNPLTPALHTHAMNIPSPSICDETSRQIASALEKIASTNENSLLPKTTIIQFDGTAKTYHRFISSFDVMIDARNIPDSAKLSYLIEYCDGKARKLIEDCLVDKTNGYKTARRILDKEFGKRHDIARAHIDSLTKGAQIAATDYEGLIQLSEDMRKCLSTLREIGYMSDVDSTSTLYAIMRRLPNFLREKWVERTVHFSDRDEEPTFEDFMNFVEKKALAHKTSFGKELIRLKASEKRQPTEVKKTKPEEKKISKTLVTASEQQAPAELRAQPATSSNTSNVPEKKGCKQCGADHHIRECKSFEELPLKKRKELVFSKRLCFNCLNYGHSSGKCRTKLECATCKGKHHTLLHSDKAESSKPTESKDASATTLCARKGNSVYFPIVAVKVHHNNKMLKTWAVLDQCSDASICTTKLLECLGIQGKRKPFTVNSVTGKKTTQDSVEVELNISSIDDECSIQLENVRSVSKLPVTTSSLASKTDIHEYQHLNDLSLPVLEHTDVDLLIGGNCSQVFVIEDQRRGNVNEPIAQKSCLGWTVIGSCSKKDRLESHAADEFHVNLQLHDDQICTDFSRLWTTNFPDSVASNKEALSVEDKIVVKNGKESVRKVNGRYQVRIPFKDTA